MGSLELIKNIVLSIGGVDFIMYVSYITIVYGVQRSISLSFYDLPTKFNFAFRLYIWVLSASIIVTGIGWGSPLFLISGGLLSLVGIFSNIQDAKWKFILHMFGAVGGILACYLGVFNLHSSLGIIAIWLTIIECMTVYFLCDKKHFIWNVEIISFGNLIGSLFILNNIL